MWDDELATVAQRWADQCQFVHDCNDCRKVGKLGQLLLVDLIVIELYLAERNIQTRKGTRLFSLQVVSRLDRIWG